MPNSKMEGFIKEIPIVPKIILEDCKLIEELTFKDVLHELKSRSLSELEMIELLNWWISYRSERNNIDSEEFTQFMQSATVLIKDESRPLNTFRYILNSSLIPPDVEIPDDVFPYNISKNFKNSEMKKCFQWVEIPLVHWARFIVKHSDLQVSPIEPCKNPNNGARTRPGIKIINLCRSNPARY